MPIGSPGWGGSSTASASAVPSSRGASPGSSLISTIWDRPSNWRQPSATRVVRRRFRRERPRRRGVVRDSLQRCVVWAVAGVARHCRSDTVASHRNSPPNGPFHQHRPYGFPGYHRAVDLCFTRVAVRHAHGHAGSEQWADTLRSPSRSVSAYVRDRPGGYRRSWVWAKKQN